MNLAAKVITADFFQSRWAALKIASAVMGAKLGMCGMNLLITAKIIIRYIIEYRYMSSRAPSVSEGRGNLILDCFVAPTETPELLAMM